MNETGDEVTGKQRHLVVGADSRIGLHLAHHLATRGEDVTGTTRRPRQGPTALAKSAFLDLADPDGWAPPACDVVYLIAAMARLAQCRNDPQMSRRVNVDGAVLVARKCLEAGARRIVFLSSDKVFDGSRPRAGADDPVSPRSVYGMQKADAERRLLGLGPAVTILRLSKVIEPTDVLFSGWIADLGAGRPITPFADLWLAPVAIGKVVDALRGLAVADCPGVFQLSGREDVSYVEAAHWIAARLGADARLVLPSTAAEHGVPPEDRPRHTTLATDRIEAVLGLRPEDPESELRSGLGL